MAKNPKTIIDKLFELHLVDEENSKDSNEARITDQQASAKNQN